TFNLSAFVEVACCVSETVVVSRREASALVSGAAPILIATNTTRLVKQKMASQIVLIIQDPRNRPLRYRHRRFMQLDSGDLATHQRGAALSSGCNKKKAHDLSLAKRNRK